MFDIKSVILLSYVILFSACTGLNNKNAVVIAKVGDRVLYDTDLADVLPQTDVEIDSISFAQTYIEKWVRNQLLLEKARKNIDIKSLKDIDYMIENYRISLIVFKYQQMLIKQKLDTVVTQEQIDEYYSKHSGNFKLDSSVVKARFVKVPKSLYDSYKIRQWIGSQREEDIISLEDYCYQNARNFDMGEDWVYFSEVLSKTPKKIDNREQFLKYNRNFEVSDSLYKYYVSVLDYKLTNDTTPQYFVERQIKDIILNRRKIEFIQELENNVYRDGVNQKKFTIYTD